MRRDILRYFQIESSDLETQCASEIQVDWHNGLASSIKPGIVLLYLQMTHENHGGMGSR